MKGKKQKANTLEIWRWILRVFLEAHFMSFFFSVFSPFRRENFLMGQKRKHLSPTIYFPSSSSNQTHSKKVFLLSFFSKAFHHSYFISKQTHLLKKSLAVVKYQDAFSKTHSSNWEPKRCNKKEVDNREWQLLIKIGTHRKRKSKRIGYAFEAINKEGIKIIMGCNSNGIGSLVIAI